MQMKLIAVAVAAFAASGCTAIDRMMDVAANGVHTYCTATTPAERMIARERFKERVYPHEVRVECFKLMDSAEFKK